MQSFIINNQDSCHKIVTKRSDYYIGQEVWRERTDIVLSNFKNSAHINIEIISVNTFIPLIKI